MNGKVLAAVTLGVLGYGAYRAYEFFHPEKASGTGSESRVYRGVHYEVAYLSDWYNGKGWRFRFTSGLAGFANGSKDWAGLAKTKEEAIGSAELTIDHYGG